MSALTTWLRAQLDDDELTARAALDHAGDGEPCALDAVGRLVVGDRAINGAATDHIGRWHPRRVLAEVEAKRRILELHQRVDAAEGWAGFGAEPACYGCGADFQEEWRP